MRRLYYREVRGSLVFAPAAVAERVAQIHHALAAPTWGELKSRLPAGELERLNLEEYLERDENDVLVVPNDSDIDPIRYVPGFTDGDYPEWLQGRQDIYLPQEICSRFGVRESSVLNGAFWRFDPRHERKMVTGLSARGTVVFRRNELLFC